MDKKKIAMLLMGVPGGEAASAWDGGFGMKDAIQGSDAAKAWESGFGAKDGIQSWAEGAGFLGNGKAPLEQTADQTLKQSSVGAMPKAMQQRVDPAKPNAEQSLDDVEVSGTQDKLSDIFADEPTGPDEIDRMKQSNDIALQNLRRSQSTSFAPRLGGGTIRLSR